MFNGDKMKSELSQAEGHKKAQKHLYLANKYKEKYLKNNKQTDLVQSLSHLGFYHHCLAVLSGGLDNANQKIYQYTQAANTFEKITKLSSKLKFKAYVNQYNGYSCVVNAGTAQNNYDKLDYYTTASTHFSEAAKIFKKEKMLRDAQLCEGWKNLTKSCAFDVQAASESDIKKRLGFNREVYSNSTKAYKIFAALKVTKLKKRTKSLELASTAWICLLKGKDPIKAVKLFEKASKSIITIGEWKTTSHFLQGLSKWASGVYTKNPKTAKKSLLEAVKIFKECNSNEMIANSISMIKQRGFE